MGSYSINDLKQLNVKEALCFGPPLIVDGKEVAYKDDNSGISPRTAIGQKADGTILMLVLGERSMDNFGGTLQDVQQIMLQYGAINAINLDGGGSTGMVYNGENLKLGDAMVVGRAVPSFVYVK